MTSPLGSISDPRLGLDSFPLSQAPRDPYPSLLIAPITLSYNDWFVSLLDRDFVYLVPTVSLVLSTLPGTK